MKSISNAKRLTSLLALLLSVVMLFAACGGDAKVSSGETPADDTSSVESDVESGEEPTGEDASSDTADGPSSKKQNASTNNNTNNTNNTNNNNNTNNTNNKNNTNTTAVNFSNSNESNIWKSLPNKNTVHVLMWRDYTKTEKKVVDQYQKMTGIKVKTTITTEREYTAKLVSMISGKNSPDVVCFSVGDFPGAVTKMLQPLDDKAFNLSADCWNKNYMNAYKVNGRYFGVAMPSAWSCEDSTYVTYYMPAVLKACGVSTMPYQLYKQGKWNWDTQNEVVRKVAAANKGYVGISMQSVDLFMCSAGVDFASYDGVNKFTNNLGSVKSGSLLTKAWQQVAQLNADKVITNWALDNVQQGKVGLFSAISFGLYNEGEWFDNVVGGYQNIQAVPVAGPKGGTAYTPVRPKCWGVPKGAKNPEGAAYFLRYFLDTSAFNLSSTFYNRQFETVYKDITKSSAKKCVMYGWGVSDYVESGTYTSICVALKAATPSNVNTVLNSKKGSVEVGIKRANKDLVRIK